MSDEATLLTPFPSKGAHVADQCPNCERDTSLALLHNATIWPKRSDGIYAPEGVSAVIEYAWGCLFCKKTAIVWAFFDESAEAYRQPVEVRIMWPERRPRRLPSEAPPEVASLYREASVAELAGALRGAAGLYRAAVEALVADQALTSRNLKNNIDGLVGKGADVDLVRDLHEARLTGNWSLHDGVTFSAEEIADIALLLRDAVDELYAQPALRTAMRAARAARRQQSPGAAGSTSREAQP